MSDAEQIKEAVTDLVTNSWRLGMAMGSGSEFFADGKVYTSDELRSLQKEKAERLDKLLGEAS